MNTPGTVGTHNWTFRLPWTLTELGNAPEAEVAPEDVVVEDLLVEEVSIDGMCGVY